MIKKFNTLLLVVLGLLVVAKVALKPGKSHSRAEREEPVVTAEVRNAEFSPTLHYIAIPGLSLENRMTNRNGYLLDVVRAVFPNVRFGSAAIPTLEGMRESLGGKGDVIIVSTRSILRDLNCICPDVELYKHQVVVYTQRRSAWSYTDAASLGQLRLGVREGLCAMPEVKDVLDKLGDRVRVYRPGELGHDHFARAIQLGEVDGYLILRQSSQANGTGDWGRTADRLLNLRFSSPVCEVPVVLGVLNTDPERAKKLVAAFEKGYREIEKSGELRRIREYYER